MIQYSEYIEHYTNNYVLTDNYIMKFMKIYWEYQVNE